MAKHIATSEINNLHFIRIICLLIIGYPIIFGIMNDKMSTSMPVMSTAMVLLEQPFHSFSIIPQTLEKMTLKDISMQKASISRVGEDVSWPLPNDSPKNWEYHSAPASRQNKRLLPQTAFFL
jgi:hypothetical protein